jgi:hypothetical protein
MNLETLREFFGWCLAFNAGLMIFTFVAITVLRDFAANLHAKMFRLEPGQVHLEFYRYLANYKIAIIVFNFVPYLALLLMSKGS